MPDDYFLIFVFGFFAAFQIMAYLHVTEVALICCLLLLLALSVIAAVGVYVYIRKKKSVEVLHKIIWKIDFNDIEFNSKQLHGSVIGRSYKSLLSIRSCTSPQSDLQVTSYARSLIPTANYKGMAVAVKSYHQDTEFKMQAKQLLELKQIKSLAHENINSFIGLCVRPPNIYLITPLCTKGSLQDILSQKEVKLDTIFKNSLISDLANGMKYIHDSALESHGRLRSACCLIDSRWVLKVSDFGLHWLRRHHDNLETGFSHHPDFMWVAPELLRLNHRPERGTQAGDVYSFAMVLHEIIFREPPFSTASLKREDILDKVMQIRQLPYRPKITSVPPDIDSDMIALMKNCWQELPIERPTFSRIIKDIIKINKGRRINILDNMLTRLERYANNLEEIVEKRTQELVHEKHKTDQLLYKMMPSLVADKLKLGEPVPPELYDVATVYFSDIVGFTSLSSMSTPIEVIDLLNDLYTCFDDVIAMYDVYKVETIGDAYMCVSGIPNRNGARHSANIADMALALREATSVFKIRHMPDTLLMIRIGVHTGPCAAGVVGLTMPRYCLFGDTVNTASRMESTSLAMKIHLSEAAYTALQGVGGYRMKCRGEIEVKGKGKVTTYWLIRPENTVSEFH